MSVAPESFFLEHEGRALYCVHYPARRDGEGTASVLHVPAFAEEMNRARRMVALQARALAGRGIEVLVPDLYGTGDSAGDFADADWSGWKRDLAACAAWLAARAPRPLVLWGMRLGCLLGLDLLHDRPDLSHRLLLWQPITDGRTFMTQFLRLRVAAGLFGRGEQETVKSLEAALARGETLEVAGYALRPELHAAIAALRAVGLAPPPDASVEWLEVASAITPASAKVIDAWRERGTRVRAHAVEGERFWSTVELTMAPRLVEASLRGLEEVPA